MNGFINTTVLEATELLFCSSNLCMEKPRAKSHLPPFRGLR